MINYLAIYLFPTIVMILFISCIIFTFTTQYKKQSAVFSVLLFIIFIINVMMIVDYNNTLVSAPKFNGEYKATPSSSYTPLEVMPSSSSFTKEVINEHNKSLKDFERK